MTKVCKICGVETEGSGQEVCGGCEAAKDTKDNPPATLCSATLADGTACGKEITADTAVCLQCEESGLAETKARHCNKCKIKLQLDALFCHKCATPVSAGEPVNDERSTSVNTDQTTAVSPSEGTSVDPDYQQTKYTKDGSHKGDSNNGSKVTSDRTPKSKGTSQNGNEQKLCIKFHVLVSKDFNIAEVDEVIMVIGHEHYGGWNPKKDKWNCLKLTRETDTYYVMELDLEFDSAWTTLIYKYAVVRGDKLKTKFEKYITHDCQDKHHNRSLNLDTFKKSNDCFNVKHHQYDGFVVPKEDSKLEKLWNNVKVYWGGHKGLAHIFMNEFCKLYTGHNEMSVQQIICHFDRVLSCLTKVYVHDWRYWWDRQAMTHEIMQPILSHILSINTADPEKRFQNACLVILLSQEFKTPLRTEDNAIMCKTFKASPNSKEDGCIEMDILKNNFDTKELMSIGNGLREAMCNSVKTKKDPSWLYGITMYHFMKGGCAPYDALAKDIKHDSSTSTRWWGTNERIYDIVFMFKKQCGPWTIALQSVLKELSPLFTMDYLLPRTIMACLRVEEIEEAILSYQIPLEVCCANLVYFLKTSEVYEYEHLNTCMESMWKNPERIMVQPYRSTKIQCWMTYRIAAQMFSHCKTIKTFVMSIHIALQTISAYSINWENDQEGRHELSSDTADDYQSLVHKAIDSIKSNMYPHKGFPIEEIIQFWNELSSIDLACKTFQEIWLCTLKTESLNMMNEQLLWSLERCKPLISIYCTNGTTYTQTIRECIENAILRVIEGNKNIDLKHQTADFHTEKKTALWTLLSDSLIREWKATEVSEGNEKEMLLNLALKWKPFLFLVHLSRVAPRSEGDECIEIIGRIVSVLQYHADSIAKGTVIVGSMHTFYQVKTELVDLVHEVLQIDRQQFLCDLDICWDQLQRIVKTVEHLTIFRSSCYLLSEVDFKVIDGVLEKQKEWNLIPLNELFLDCDFRQGKIGIMEHVPTCVREILPEMEKLKQSNILMGKWQNACKTEMKLCSSLEDIGERIWTPVHQWWKATSNKIKEGSFLFQEMDFVLRDISDRNAVYSELLLMEIPDNVARERIDQLGIFKEMQTCVKAAVAILQIAETYNSERDFNTIREIVETVIEGNKNIDLKHQTVEFLTEQKTALLTLLSDSLIREWKAIELSEGNAKEMLLSLALKWKPFLFLVNPSPPRSEDNECMKIIARIVSVLQYYADSIAKGTVIVGSLVKFYQVKTELVDLLHEVLQIDRQQFLHDLDFCWDQLQRIVKTVEHLTIFRSSCYLLSEVDFKVIDGVLEKQKERNLIPLNELFLDCDFRQGKIGIMEYIPTCVREILPEMKKLKQSNILMGKWLNACKTEMKLCYSLEDIAKRIWTPVHQWWKATSKRIIEGSFFFHEMDSVLRDISDRSAVYSELLLMEIPDDVARKRIDQMGVFKKMQTCVKAAVAILQFAETYNLEGDFNTIRKIVETRKDSEFQMKDFPTNMKGEIHVLANLTKERIKCLEALTQSSNLVKWMRDSMKTSGLCELKVFTELASMAAGDDQLKRERVMCFEACVSGFSPLIFDLKTNMGYQQVLRLCEQIWTELEQNPRLPEQMINTNKILRWFKDVEKSHGSVEKSSLIQCEMINSSGRYIIGGKVNTDCEAKNLDNIIHLIVEEESDYNFRQLQDLQSRLVLVAGKGERKNEGVNRFTMIFDSIIRLAKVYIKLSCAGCVLFRQWKAEFLCDTRKEVCVIFEFGQEIFKGYRNIDDIHNQLEDDELANVIPALADFMDTCLVKWLHYIKENRTKLKQLNFFTIDQLVLLQEELVKVGGDSKPIKYVYPLLSSVKKDCTVDDLIAAIDNTTKLIQTGDTTDDGEEEQSGEQKQETGEEDEINLNERVKQIRFIDEMEESGYNRELAMKALNQVDPKDIEEGITWCMEHDGEEEHDGNVGNTDENEQDLSMSQQGGHTSSRELDQPNVSLQYQIGGIVKHIQSNDERDLFGAATSLITSRLVIYELASLNNSRNGGLKDLLSKLHKVWEGFFRSITSNVCDYLSLKRLGMILECLAEQDDRIIHRVFPAGFEEGLPNLIVCPSCDVLTTTLALYAIDRNSPLPLSDEVLICTPDTTLDQVDIFLMRALFGSNGKIHCLVNGDLLDSDVGDVAERLLHEYMDKNKIQDSPHAFRLFIVCGSQNEYRSQIIASLDKYRRFAPQVDMEKLQRYVKHNLVKESSNEIHSAAVVDFDKSNVRVIKSPMSGVRKTLYRSRRVEDLLNLQSDQTTGKTVAPSDEYDSSVSVPIHTKNVDTQWVTEKLLNHTIEPGKLICRIFHLDITQEVEHGVDNLLFNLIVLGCLTDNRGYVWRRSPNDLYLIETVPLLVQSIQGKREGQHYSHRMLHVLPSVTCRGPLESLAVYEGNPPRDDASDQLFDRQMFQSDHVQRPFQYLLKLDEGSEDGKVEPEIVKGNQQLCLQTLVRDYGILKEELRTLKKVMKEYKAKITQQTNQLDQQDVCLQQQNQQIQRYISYSNKLKEGLDDSEERRHMLSLGLSKFAGAQLTGNNPIIADLSDTNRPTKLAERYSELYDNEWTDAYEDLSGTSDTDEQTRINELLELLKASYDECVQLSEPFRDTLKSLTTVTLRVKVPQESHVRDKIKQDQEVMPTAIDKSVQTSFYHDERGASKAGNKIQSSWSMENTLEYEERKIDNQELAEISGRRIMHDYQYIHSNDTIDNQEFAEISGRIMNDYQYMDSNDTIDNQEFAEISGRRDMNNEQYMDSNEKATGKANLPRGFTSNVDTGEITAEVKVQVEFTAEQKKIMSDIKKKCGRELEEEMNLSTVIAQKIAFDRNINAEKHVPIMAYITKCAELCWFMMIQEPPVVIGFHDVKTGDPFNKETYKAYTRTGKRLDFIVWPPLYLYKDGPMLSKGIAQGAN